MRVMVFGDSNSWGTPPDGSGLRMGPDTRWPQVMARTLGCELVEEALPGRTTIHDDPEMLGPTMNGLRHLPVALLSNAPLDLVVIMLGTNDCKARFQPGASRIAANLGRLVECVRATGAGIGPWSEAPAPSVALIAPVPLGARANDSGWERFAEWRGGRAASLGLADALATLGRREAVPVFDAGTVVRASDADPIHMDAAAHRALGLACAQWLEGHNGHV